MVIGIYSLSEFLDMDSAYWGLGFIKGVIYFSLCTHNPNKSATFFSFNPVNKKIKKIFTLSEIIPPKKNCLPQGKVHTPLFEGTDGNLYFGTHFAYPFGRPQSIQFEGGHLISFNPKTKLVQDLGVPVKNEGIVTMILDKQKMVIYGLSAPSFEFFIYNINEKKYSNLGKITKNGSICRALVLDVNGNVYGSFEKNHIFKYNNKCARIEYLKAKLPDSDKKVQEWKGKYRGGVNYIGRKIWRSALWHEKTQKIYGIHAETSRLFNFDPRTEVINSSIFIAEDNLNNRLDQIYPTLSLALYKDELFYISVNGFFDYSRSENIVGYPSLISYNIMKNKKINHGKIINNAQRVLGVAGSTMTDNGMLYLLGAVEVIKDEEYNKFNVIDGKSFNLGLIEIDTNQLKYE